MSTGNWSRRALCVLAAGSLVSTTLAQNYQAPPNGAGTPSVYAPQGYVPPAAPAASQSAPVYTPGAVVPIGPRAARGIPPSGYNNLSTQPAQMPGQVMPVPTSAPFGPGAYQRVEHQEPAASSPMPAASPMAPATPMNAAAAAATPAAPTGSISTLASAGPPAPGEHPLAPAIRWAKLGLAEIEKIQDYSCTLVKRERIDGALNEYEYMFIKVRQKPFSVYMYFLGPAKVKGQEALFVEGQNDGNLLAHPNGIRHKLIGTVRLPPTSMLAMSGNRYPITELGIRRLTARLIEVGEHDMQYGECEVKMIPGAKVSGRECTCIQVLHPTPRKEFIFNMARIYVDNQLNVPIRYEAYEWPKEAGGPPMLVEEYTYLNLKVNNGFTDQDFDSRNPNYQFQ